MEQTIGLQLTLRLKSTALAAYCAFTLIASAWSAHASRPEWTYRVLRSPHFEIIFRQEQEPLAHRYLTAAEQAYAILFPLFQEGPSKTLIVIEDDIDLSNGEASFLPYPHITIYPVLPPPGDTIDDYGDWPLELMLHEYTHILNMHPAHGIYAPFKYIFGTLIRPNAILPRWYLEGLAVYTESIYSDHGRLRARQTQAAARALTLDARLDNENIARINQSDLESWPFGHRPYLYGGWWWQSVQQDTSKPMIATWNQNFSRRLPFLLNSPLREQTGLGAQDLFTQATQRIRAQAERELKQLSQDPQPSARPVAAEKGEQAVFAISPSGHRLIYWVGTPGEGTLAKVKVRTHPDQDFKNIPGLLLFRTLGTLRVRWLNEDEVIFDAISPNDLYVSYRDLWTYNFRTNQVLRLTHQARAQQPAVSIDSPRDIVFIQNVDGGTQLSRLLPDGQIQTLWKGNLEQRLSEPEFLDRDQILFSLRERGGLERLWVYNLKTREAKVWSQQLTQVQNLRRITNGFVLTDAGTGVRNAYWWHDGRFVSLTNSMTEVSSADFDPLKNEVVVSELTGSGRTLRAYPWATRRPAVIASPKFPSPPQVSAENFSITSENYQPISYLWPRYWIPFIYQVEGGWLFQGATQNQDPAGRNSYSLLGSYDTVTGRGSYGADYVNHSTPVDIGLGYSKYHSYLGASGVVLESQLAALSLRQHWPWHDRNHSWSLGGHWFETQSSTSTFRRIGPRVSWQYHTLADPTRKWLQFSAELSHTEYLAQTGYLAYGRSAVSLANEATLSNGHKIRLQTRAALAPKLPFRRVLTMGDPNIGGNYAVNLTNSEFLLRGYPSGAFVGRKVLNANLEYAWPLRLERGFGTFPVFFGRSELALFADTLAVDGAAYNTQAAEYRVRMLSEFYTGAGAEMRLGTTMGYHLPVTLVFGLYYGFDQRFGGGLSPFFAFSFSGLGSLQNKTP